MQTVASPLRDAEGHITGSLGVSRDLTELKKLHEQVLLADRMSSLGILAAGIAHEINNPLAVVIANLDAALEQLRRVQKSTAPTPPFPPETLEMLDDCLESADRVRQIVGDLKVFSRADENKRSLVDLPRVVRTSLKLVKNEIRHRATLITDFGDVPAVLGNEARLGQVFLNLLVNAAQSVPEGNVARHTITVRTLTHASGCAVVEVRDTGLGISPEALAHIFEPFFTTKPIGVGTGLGLAICRQIVTGVGGEITVDSEVGTGTVFRVLLPAAIDQTVEIVAPPPPPPSGRRGRILLIDDDPEVLKTTARTLAGRHEVIALLRAREALDLITAGETFDLVISDLMMPEMTGMDLHGALSAIAPQHAKRMIFLTGGAFTPSARGFLRQVDNPRLDKPFDRQNLIGLVDRVLA
jgi:nitrogen-specific signal transduction histidine kinase